MPRQVRDGLKGTFWEAVQLIFGLACSLGIIALARWLEQYADPQWARIAHVAVLVTDVLTGLQLVLPRVLNLLIEATGLLFTVLTIAAAGIHQVQEAYRTGRVPGEANGLAKSQDPPEDVEEARRN